MKKFILTFLAYFIMSLQTSNSQFDETVSNYKSSLDKYIATIIDKNYEAQDSLALWNLMDQFTLSIFNDVVKNEELLQVLGPYDKATIDDIKLSLNRKPGRSSFGFAYQFARPPKGIEQDFGISITQLTKSDRPYFVIDWALWSESPVAERQKASQPLYIRTFRIVDKIAKTGQYEITAKQEETNFFKRFVFPGKIKHRAYTKPWFTFGGELDASSIKCTKSGIYFDIWYSLCSAGQACYHDVTVTYSYRNGKLSATKYYERDSQAGYDSKTGKYITKDLTVNLVP